MYAYCNNNPVMYVDPSGEFIDVLTYGTLATVGLVFVLGTLVYDALTDQKLGKTVANIVDAVSSKTDIHSSTKEAPKSVTGEKKDSDISPPDVTYPGNDPTVAPDGYEWTGPDQQGGKRGGYKNKDPNKKDSWHPDLDHPDGVEPHWDYNDGQGHKWRVFPDRIKFVGK